MSIVGTSRWVMTGVAAMGIGAALPAMAATITIEDFENYTQTEATANPASPGLKDAWKFHAGNPGGKGSPVSPTSDISLLSTGGVDGSQAMQIQYDNRWGQYDGGIEYTQVRTLNLGTMDLTGFDTGSLWFTWIGSKNGASLVVRLTDVNFQSISYTFYTSPHGNGVVNPNPDVTAYTEGTITLTNAANLNFDLSQVTEFMIAISGNGGTGQVNIDNISLHQVPEPASMSLLGLGGLALLARRRSKVTA